MLYILVSVTAMYPSLVVVQPRKIHPCLTERVLMGHKESNQSYSNVERLHAFQEI